MLGTVWAVELVGGLSSDELLLRLMVEVQGLRLDLKKLSELALGVVDLRDRNTTLEEYYWALLDGLEMDEGSAEGSGSEFVGSESAVESEDGVKLRVRKRKEKRKGKRKGRRQRLEKEWRRAEMGRRSVKGQAELQPRAKLR
ncbi:hypothetical protein PYCCODRAFT_1426398 [Trametes coccinea BRFM310]|uniref:Uncharacterized protein n=1 Tax=Trametes coccinea (strain BRFM310) TaxID=1353009 RepID=A0A1Y2IHA3_TRAC3|nr:hypothetical protein PYCCODRAFT_1426398 [Trametes coccinea BRFM310]